MEKVPPDQPADHDTSTLSLETTQLKESTSTNSTQVPPPQKLYTGHFVKLFKGKRFIGPDYMYTLGLSAAIWFAILAIVFVNLSWGGGVAYFGWILVTLGLVQQTSLWLLALSKPDFAALDTNGFKGELTKRQIE